MENSRLPAGKAHDEKLLMGSNIYIFYYLVYKLGKLSLKYATIYIIR